MLVWVYTYQNNILLEITCNGSIVSLQEQEIYVKSISAPRHEISNNLTF